MKTQLQIAFLLVLVTSCTSVPPPATELTALLERYHQDYYGLFPIQATYAGETGFNHLLPNPISEKHRSNLKEFYQRYLDRVARYDQAHLNPEDRISCDILRWECELNLEGLEFPTYLTPVNQFESLHLTMGQFASGTGAQPFKTVEDYENWLKRLHGFLAWCDTAIVSMRLGVAAGHVLPKALTEKTIPQMAELSRGPVKDHLFYSPAKNLPESFTEKQRNQIQTQYHDIVEKRIIPAFTRLHTFLMEEYLPASRTTSGISATPGGRAYYDHQIKVYTTTTMSADEIFELGRTEVARIEREMEKIKDEVKFQGTLKEFFAHLRVRPELRPFKHPEEVIANFQAIHRRMKPQLTKLFDKTPKAAFEVRRTEAFREASASAEYSPSSTDGSRPGIFYVPIPDVSEYNTLSDEDLFLHEAIPGHHYQIALTQENKALPKFRRVLWYSAYGEGWALYTESLGKELGLYTDPYQHFGMLSAEMHRAIRLVVDVGIHVKGWTRAQAIQYSLEHEAEPEAGIIAEIERYMSWPGQALSYKVGQLKIRELRARAETALGASFNIREFHNQVLESGCVPLKLLEDKIDRWINAESRRLSNG